MVIGRLNFCDPKLLGIEREGRNAWRWICIAGIALILVDSVVVVLLLLQQRIRRPSDAKEDDVLRFRSILISIDIDTVGHVTSYSCSDSNSDRRVVQVVYGRWSVGAIVLLDCRLFGRCNSIPSFRFFGDLLPTKSQSFLFWRAPNN